VDSSLVIRPPREDEWKICRMLLPETFADVAGREYLLATRPQQPRIAGAASFRRIRDGVSGVRLHVIPPFRRQGIASLLLERLCADAAVAEGISEISREPAAESFCARAGFIRVEGLTAVEAAIERMREYARALRDRSRVPESARLVTLPEAPLDQVARLHAEYVVHAGELNPWRAAIASELTALRRSLVLLIGARVEGILLWHMDGSTAVVRSRVVTPQFQRGWANALLIAAGLDAGWEAGARRVRFTYADSNRDTRKMAQRLSGEVVSVVARFQRLRGDREAGGEVEPAADSGLAL
jgi:GNAT superfamily N-acetyltransferase